MYKYSIKSKKYYLEKMSQEKLREIALYDKYWSVRLEAVKRLTDQKTLKLVALNDDDSHVRLEAAEKLADPKAIKELALSQSNCEKIVKIAISKIESEELLLEIANIPNLSEDLLIEIIKKLSKDAISKIKTNSRYINAVIADILIHITPRYNHSTKMYEYSIKSKKCYLTKMTSEELRKIASNDSDCDRCEAAQILVEQRLTDQATLAFIALNAEDSYVRLRAVKRLTVQETLKLVVSNNDEHLYLRCEAIKRLTDQKAIKELALNHSDCEKIVKTAISKIEDEELLLEIVNIPSLSENLLIEIIKKLSKDAISKIETDNWYIKAVIADILRQATK